MTISLIAAMTPGTHVIGNKGNIPWRLSNDMKRFKSLTMGQPIIMGRKTHESIGKALPGRDNIVVSRNEEYKAADGCHLAANIKMAFVIAHGLGHKNVCVIGGGEVYKETMKYADTLYLTYVHGKYNGDAFFPPIWNDWKVEEFEMNEPDEKNEAWYSYVTYKRNRPPQRLDDTFDPSI